VGVSQNTVRPSSRAQAAASDTACCDPFVTMISSADTAVPRRVSDEAISSRNSCSPAGPLYS
jgi:hypothetical protein